MGLFLFVMGVIVGGIAMKWYINKPTKNLVNNGAGGTGTEVNNKPNSDNQTT